MNKYFNLLFPILQKSRKDVKQKVLKALYEMGTEGDFTRIKNKQLDNILEEICCDEDMPDFIGELYDLLAENSTQHH